MAEFFAMGGYGAYIWPCYGLSLVVLGGVIGRRRNKLRALRRRDKDKGR